MYAQLGNVIFQNLKGFTEFSKTGSASYSEHQLLDGKPKLQKTGSSLEEIALSIRLHASFCNPLNELTTLRDLRDNGEILPLLYGNGRLEGTFVITQLTSTVEDADPQGNVFSYVVSCTLREYVTQNRLQQEQAEFKKNAAAVGDKKPVSVRKINPPTGNAIVASLVTRSENNAASINRVMIERGGIQDAINRQRVLTDLKSISSKANELLNLTNEATGPAFNDNVLQVLTNDCIKRSK